jgi:hypothetical protein
LKNTLELEQLTNKNQDLHREPIGNNEAIHIEANNGQMGITS